MVDITKIIGRLGNQMFLFSFAYNYARKNKMDDRYFQEPKFFAEHSDEIKSLFQNEIPPLRPKVAIHVRRGDYINNGFYVDLMKTDYYEKSMGVFKGESFIVFSDDIEFCKKQEIFKDCEFIHGTEVSDMNNMASCTGHIIANSSFSWWAAYISPYTKKIIAPSKYNWYSDGRERTKCPETWIRI